ncbi:MAG: hypothetical protein WC860_02895 [Candidatus Margulisiibacteriota bacterium]|jgi:hypothetical protein
MENNKKAQSQVLIEGFSQISFVNQNPVKNDISKKGFSEIAPLTKPPPKTVTFSFCDRLILKAA